MMAKHTTAAEMAQTVGVDPDAFRAVLRNAKLRSKGKADWEVALVSAKYSAMRTLLATLLRRNNPTRTK